MLPSKKFLKTRKKENSRRKYIVKEKLLTSDEEYSMGISLGNLYSLYKQYEREDELKILSDCLKEY